jgi:hypothetical protein
MNAMRHPLTLMLPLTLALALAACQPAKNRNLSGSGMDMFAPVKMRLHPLTRFIPAAGEADSTAEARLEFTDQFNDIGKAAGSVYFELFVYQTLVPNHQGDRIGFWKFDINTPEANEKAWDAITRTYLFKLPVNAAAKKQSRLILVATFTLPNSTRLTDDITLNLK